MTGALPISRRAITLAIVLPVAALVGYALAGPLTYTSLAVYGAVFGVLLLPVLLTWHHPLLIMSINAAVDIFFLPGKPHLWMVLVLVSLTVSIVTRFLNPEAKLISVPSITWTLGALILVVLITAKLTGGISLRSLGGSVYGGKKYFFIFLAILVYLGISVRPIPLAKARFYTGAYFLSSLTAMFSNLVYIAGPAYWWLFALFPTDFAMLQAAEDFSLNAVTVKFARLGGMAPTAQAALCFLLATCGLRGVLDFSKPWRMGLLLLAIAVSSFSGFRAHLIFCGMILVAQFCLEGLLRTRLALMLFLAGLLGVAALIPLSTKLPLSVQRSLSFLPIETDPAVKLDARASTEWRLEMWRVITPEVPRYFWLGKGYATSAADFYLAQESVLRGLARDYEMSLLSGDYHNGPLSVIIPFGIWGVLAFVAFLVAALRVLYLNYRHGHPALANVNTLLFAFFIARVVFFLTVFGSLTTDMVLFAGILGLSVSLNGGVRTSPVAQSPSPAPKPAPVSVPGREGLTPPLGAWRRR